MEARGTTPRCSSCDRGSVRFRGAYPSHGSPAILPTQCETSSAIPQRRGTQSPMHPDPLGGCSSRRQAPEGFQAFALEPRRVA